MRFTLAFVVVCSTAIAAPRVTPARRLKTKDKVTSASYHDRKTPLPLRSGF